MDGVEVVYIKPKLMGIVSDLTAPLSERLFHVRTRGTVNIVPQA